MSLIHATLPPSLPPFLSLSYPISESGDANRRGPNAIDAAAAAAPAVVCIKTRTCTGSGFVITEDGWVVTNEHVIAKTAKGELVDILFKSGLKFTAKVRETFRLFFLLT